MRRRPPRRAELIELPAALRAFDAQEWFRAEDVVPGLPRAWDLPGRHRWQRARNDWFQEHGVSQLAEIRARRAERLAEAEIRR